MTTATQRPASRAKVARPIYDQCRICQEYKDCWGVCEGKEIDPYLKAGDLACGLGPPAEPELICFRLAETRHGDFDPITCELVSMEHTPILQG